MTKPLPTPASTCSTSIDTTAAGATFCSAQLFHVTFKGCMSLTNPAVLCRVYRQMKVPWQITLTGVVLLCSMIHYITKQQMYENVRPRLCLHLPAGVPHL